MTDHEPDPIDARILTRRDTDPLADAMALCYSLANGNGTNDDGAEYLIASYFVSGENDGLNQENLVDGLAQFAIILASALGRNEQSAADVIRAFMHAKAA
jgi:hypothetical protein